MSFRQIRSRDCPYGLYTLLADLQQYLFHCGEGPTWDAIRRSLKTEFQDQRVAGDVVVPIWTGQTIKIFVIQYYLYEAKEERLNKLSSVGSQSLLDGLKVVFRGEESDTYYIPTTHELVTIDNLAASREILTDRTLFDKLFHDDNAP